MTGKIIRAKPKFINQDYFKNLNQRITIDKDELFFNLGRSALKYLLQGYSKYLNKKLTIAMQSFNCRVVADAAIEVGCIIYLLDINLNDFSININSLINCKTEIDVLLLTHYQGIPNEQYVEIVELCQKSNILLIDDISQTENSKINNIKVGSLSNFSIRSFAFDKPYSTLEGGSLVINNSTNIILKELLIKNYNNIPFEPKLKSRNDIKTLKFLLRFSEPEFYHDGLNNLPVLRIYSLFFGFKTIYRLSYLVQVNSYIRELLKRKNHNKPIKIKRLRSDKINLLMLQKTDQTVNVNIKLIEKIAVDLGLKPLSFNNFKVQWNRYSIIDNNNILKNFLIKNNIEASNYNWPVPLHLLFKNNKHFILRKSYSNSEFCSKNILNIPLWKNLNFIENKF